MGIEREEQDMKNDIYAQKKMYDKSGAGVITLSEIINIKRRERHAELQNLMGSIRHYASDNNLSSFMLTTTTNSQENLQKYATFNSHLDQSKKQIKLLRKYSTALTDDKYARSTFASTFFYIKMLELTKKNNIHMHQSLFTNSLYIFDLVKTAQRIHYKKYLKNEIGRTHLTMSTSDYNRFLKQNKINDDYFSFRHVGEDILVESENFFYPEFFSKKGGNGFLIRVLEDVKDKSIAANYVMKYVLKTLSLSKYDIEIANLERKKRETLGKRMKDYLSKQIELLMKKRYEELLNSNHRNLFSKLNIRALTFKQRTLLNLTDFRNLKGFFVEHNIINSDNKKFSLYDIKKQLDNQESSIDKKVTEKKEAGEDDVAKDAKELNEFCGTEYIISVNNKTYKKQIKSKLSFDDPSDYEEEKEELDSMLNRFKQTQNKTNIKIKIVESFKNMNKKEVKEDLLLTPSLLLYHQDLIDNNKFNLIEIDQNLLWI